MTTFGEAIARVRAHIDANEHTEARRLLREAGEIAESYAGERRALATVVERQRMVLRELEATLKARTSSSTS